jgi:hypothetical protein
MTLIIKIGFYVFSVFGILAGSMLIREGLKRSSGPFSIRSYFSKNPPLHEKKKGQLIGEGVFVIFFSVVIIAVNYGFMG